MKKTIDTNKLSDRQKRALVRHGIIEKSDIEPELDNIAVEAMQFFHRHFTNDELANMAGKTTASWVWNIANGNTVKMYQLIIDRLQISPSELVIIQSASRVLTNTQLRKPE